MYAELHQIQFWSIEFTGKHAPRVGEHPCSLVIQSQGIHNLTLDS